MFGLKNATNTDGEEFCVNGIKQGDMLNIFTYIRYRSCNADMLIKCVEFEALDFKILIYAIVVMLAY